MVNTELAEVLAEATKHIVRWAKKGDVAEEKQTALTERSHESAWRAVVHLISVLEHAQESDLAHKMFFIGEDLGKTPRELENYRLRAKQEDRAFMEAKLALRKLLDELLQDESLDPKAKVASLKDAMLAKRKELSKVHKAESRKAQAFAKKAKTEQEKQDRWQAYQDIQDDWMNTVRRLDKELKGQVAELGLKLDDHNRLQPLKPKAKKQVAKKALLKKVPAKKAKAEPLRRAA